MKKSIIFILALALFSCSTSIDNVTITQVESNYPIIIGFVPSQDLGIKCDKNHSKSVQGARLCTNIFY